MLNFHGSTTFLKLKICQLCMSYLLSKYLVQFADSWCIFSRDSPARLLWKDHIHRETRVWQLCEKPVEPKKTRITKLWIKTTKTKKIASFPTRPLNFQLFVFKPVKNVHTDWASLDYVILLLFTFGLYFPFTFLHFDCYVGFWMLLLYHLAQESAHFHLNLLS